MPKKPPPPPIAPEPKPRKKRSLPVLGPHGAELKRYQDRKTFSEALKKYNPRLPAPTPKELGEILLDYIACEAEETQLNLRVAALREKRNALCRTWLARRGTARPLRIRGETWVVQGSRWGGFMFRRFQAAPKVEELDLDLPPKAPAEEGDP